MPASPVRTLTALAALVVAASIPAGVPARADVFVMDDGTTIDGKVIREDGGVIWIKTFTETKRVSAVLVRSRQAVESQVEKYESARVATEKDPKDIAALWAFFLVARANEASLPKGEPSKILQRVLKLNPDHLEARDANGDTRFDGQWVKKSDLPRLEEEAAREKFRQGWQEKIGTTCDIAEGEHWLLVDNTHAKDGADRVKQMDQAYDKVAEMFGAKFWDGRGDALAFKRFEDYAHYVEKVQTALPMPEWKYKAALMRDLGGFWRQRPSAMVMRFVTKDGEEGMWHAHVHNAAHVCVWNHFGNVAPPEWLNEGLGSYVEIEVMGSQKSFCVGDSKAGKDKGTSDQKKKKPSNKEQGKAVNEYKDRAIAAIRDGTFPEMRKFLRMELGEYGPEESGGALGLVTFLSKKDPEKFKKLVSVLRSYATQKADPAKADEVWQKSYEWKLIEDMEKEFKSWALTEW